MDLSTKTFNKLDNAAKEMLYMLAYLDTQFVSYKTILTLCDETKTLADVQSASKHIIDLHGNIIIKADNNMEVKLLPIYKDSIRNTLNGSDKSGYILRLARALKNQTDPELNTIHIQHFADCIHDDTELYSADLAQCLTSWATDYIKLHPYADSTLLAMAAVNCAIATLGENNETTMQAIINLVVAYNNEGKYQEAIDQLGDPTIYKNYPGYRIILYELATSNHYIGNYSEAQQLYKMVQEVNPSDDATVIHRIGKVYSDQCKYDLCEDHYQRALSILGNDETADTATLLTDLAGLHLIQKRFEDVPIDLIRSLRIQTSILGYDHQDLAKTLCICGEYFQLTGSDYLAELLYTHAGTIYKGRLPLNHPDVCRAQCSLAKLYYTQGKYDETVNLLHEVLEYIRSRKIQCHSGILQYLGLTYKKLGEFTAVDGIREELLNKLNNGNNQCINDALLALLPFYDSESEDVENIKVNKFQDAINFYLTYKPPLTSDMLVLLKSYYLESFNLDLTNINCNRKDLINIVNEIVQKVTSNIDYQSKDSA